MILLIGGTGTLGSAITRRLAAAGIPVTVMSRDPDNHAGRFPSGVDFVRGDLGDKDALERAVKEKTTVVNAAHSLFGRGRSASKYIDDLGGRQLVKASVAAGVKRFVYVSAWFPPRMASNRFIAAKKSVEEQLRSSGLPHLIVRPTAFMDIHAEQLIGQRIKANQKVNVFGPGTATRNYVAADDVADLLVDELRNPTPDPRTVNVGGPQNLSTKDVIATYESLLGKPAKVSHAPLAVASIMHWLFRPFHPGLSQVMDMVQKGEAGGDEFDLSKHPDCMSRETLEHWARRQV